MAQSLVQEQVQRQQQVQRLSAQQMLQVKLLEMPLTELEESIRAELDDNPALEVDTDNESAALGGSADDSDVSGGSADGTDDTADDFEREERSDALDQALEGMGRDDEMPDYASARSSSQAADYEEMVYGDTTSFYDKLQEQVMELELTEQQHTVLDYLIGSLDDDGLLRKDLETLSDELAIYNNVDVSMADMQDALRILQSFDPAGIGARSLQECLLLQLDRKIRGVRSVEREVRIEELAREVISEHYEAFTRKHWNKIKAEMQLSDYQVEAIRKEIHRLNPKPGASLGETEGRSTQQITPDFIVETSDDGRVTFYLNQGHLPELYVSESFAQMLAAYKDNKGSMNRQQKEALLYAKEKVEKARGFIEAVNLRRHTLYVTMKAIIDWQLPFFRDGDESDLRPMILKDIADKTGLDISTISRVSNIKYAQTRWGIFPLRFFFSDGYTTEGGEELSTRKIKIALREMIAAEDSKHPMSDDLLAQRMKEQGFPIARRTVAKYREQMGIPVARLRK